MKKKIDIKEIKEKHEALDYSNGWAEKAQEYKLDFFGKLKSKEKKSINKTILMSKEELQEQFNHIIERALNAYVKENRKNKK